MGFVEHSEKPTGFDNDIKKLEQNLQNIDSSLDEVLAVLNKKISFDELCKAVSQQIDDFIPKHETSEHVSFVGGNCFFEITGFIKKCSVTADLYFRDSGSEWSKVTMSGTLPLSRFSEESVKGDIAEIAKQKGLKVEIVHPQVSIGGNAKCQ